MEMNNSKNLMEKTELIERILNQKLQGGRIGRGPILSDGSSSDEIQDTNAPLCLTIGIECKKVCIASCVTNCYGK